MTRTSAAPSAALRIARATGLVFVLAIALFAAAPRAIAAEPAAACAGASGYAAASCPAAAAQPTGANAVVGQGWG
jgi:hypothetical protein